MQRRLYPTLLLIALALTCATAFGVNYSDLKVDQQLAQFRTECVYENEAKATIGARFRHIPSGFVADLFTIQSVPQAFMWFNTLPPSDQGESHTCEHLLLGKGTKGRYVASMEDMLLGESSAFTMQLQTYFSFNCGSGTDNFFKLFEAKLDALVHPNYSDEEIRREVCHVGLTEDQASGTVGLEEKGTVYNEMVRSFESPWGELMLELARMVYGPNHPLSYESGGYPPAIRTMTPADLRRFQEGAYHINNMGAVISIADDITIENCLAKLSEILNRIEPNATVANDPASLNERLPAKNAAPIGTVKLVSFPAQLESDPGLLVYSWPADFDMNNDDRFLLELFVENLSGDQTSLLYRRLIDSQTRLMDVGAAGIGSWVSNEKGQAINIYFDDIKRESCTPEMIDSVRSIILREIMTVASFADGSAELTTFNQQALERISSRERGMRTFLNSPPRFGERSSGAQWMTAVQRLHKSGGFKRSLAFADEIAYARQQVSNSKNIWRDLVSQWRLVENRPYAVAAVANPQVIGIQQAERQARIEAYVSDLKTQYAVSSEQEAIQKFKTDYDTETAKIDAAAATIQMPGFVTNPPMTLDDPLKYVVDTVAGQVPVVASKFENITNATTGLAFNLNVIPEDELLYIAALPTLLTEIGIDSDSGTLTFDQMQGRLRSEISSLNAYFNVNYRTERAELVLRAAGSTQAEGVKALEWIDSILFNSYIELENLPRIRDAIDYSLAGLRSTMRGSEEFWVEGPADSYWRQSNPLLLATDCFMTKAFNLYRVKWMLRDAGDPNKAGSFVKFLEDLAARGANLNRKQLGELLATLSGDQKFTWSAAIVADLTGKYLIADSRNAELIQEVSRDLQRVLSDIPDTSLATDWQFLCWQTARDASMDDQTALAQIRGVFDKLRHTDNVRVFMISGSATKEALMPRLAGIVGKLDPQPSVRQKYNSGALVTSRYKERTGDPNSPIYVGLVNENTRSGVIVNTADCASFTSHTQAGLIDFLAARLYGGGGAHSMFMKTWGAGLAYSNGLRSRESTGRIVYYAERCPDLAQTMQFVVGELKKAPNDPALGDYTVAQAFNANRAATTYEARGEAIARDLADGNTPAVVREFRQGILDLHKQPDFYNRVQGRMEPVYGLLLPDYGPTAQEAVTKSNAVNFVIGPEKQFESYERYLQSVEPGAKLIRLYPRDYWMVSKQ
ncbi:MAG: hypothetical protein WBP42_12030 [Candidatus Zixiibacteriota bacterium]